MVGVDLGLAIEGFGVGLAWCRLQGWENPCDAKRPPRPQAPGFARFHRVGLLRLVPEASSAKCVFTL